MINFDDVVSGYPERLRGFKESIIKEYLQYRILDIVYASKYANSLVFLGGTAIRIAHGGMRFSEDLDFDNIGMSEECFGEISRLVESELARDGYTVTIKNVFKGAYHCYIKFPGLLFAEGVSGYKEERILIQLDAEAQDYVFTPDKFLINRFGMFRYINTVPVSLLLAQKIFASLNRSRAKGRDFFDVVFLVAKTNPDYGYLSAKAGITDKGQLVDALRKRIDGLNMKSLADDVAPFLFDSQQADRVRFFKEWLDVFAQER